MAVRFGGYDWIKQTRTCNSSFASAYANDMELSANSVEEGKLENDRCEAFSHSSGSDFSLKEEDDMIQNLVQSMFPC
eukprot:5142528-Karenia_brevis.AAC.1